MDTTPASTASPSASQPAIRGACHCGAVSFTLDAPMPPALTRCTCSFCAKRGALLAYCEPSSFTFAATPPEADVVYRWNTGLVAHHFCGCCGCGTFSDSPAFQPDKSWDGVTRRIGVNARLFEDFDAASAPVTVIDGKHLW